MHKLYHRPTPDLGRGDSLFHPVWKLAIGYALSPESSRCYGCISHGHISKEGGKGTSLGKGVWSEHHQGVWNHSLLLCCFRLNH